MKTWIWVGLLALAPMAAGAQQETLVSGQIQSGGFGAPVLKFTEVNQSFGFFLGGRGGWILNESFVIGGGGYGLTNQNHYLVEALTMGYGGLDLEYVVRPNELVHVSFAVLVGGGGVRFWPDPSAFYYDSAFFVAEPGFNLELNVTPSFRLNLGGSYRSVSSLAVPGLTNADLSGWSGNVQFKFGKFGGI